ncbi:MAG: DNA replication complex GINS family protein [Thermoplasmata archaeon]|nr:DNA replication complex GINS family protein [Thermoplasmata archaeon]
MLGYSKLRNIEQNEKSSAKLTNIGADFYQQAGMYIQELEEKIEEERVKNPSSRKITLLSDELRNARRILNNIFERREKKIVLNALMAARGGEKSMENLTREEKIFYDRLVELLEENRRNIFEVKKKDVVVIRILKNIPQFVDSNMRKYTLKKEDIISLPSDVARILIERKAAEKIEPSF